MRCIKKIANEIIRPVLPMQSVMLGGRLDANSLTPSCSKTCPLEMTVIITYRNIEVESEGFVLAHEWWDVSESTSDGEMSNEDAFE